MAAVYHNIDRQRVFVTGANSLLATNTIIALLQQGFAVQGLLRCEGNYKGPRHEHLNLVEGDIQNIHDLDRALKDCQYAIHIAALTDQSRLTYEDYERTNVLGTTNVASACVRQGVQKLIYVSTANVFGFGNQNHPGNENQSTRPPFTHSHYTTSKLKAQRALLNFADDLEITIVNPSFMIGAYDTKPSSGRIILMGLRHKLVLCPPGGKNFVSVTDVAKGLIRALIEGKHRQAYILANENLKYRDFFKKLRRQINHKFLIIELPSAVFLAIGYMGNLLRFMGIPTEMSLTNMRMVCTETYYSNAKSISQLNLSYEPIDAGIEKALRWFENQMRTI